MPVKAFSLVKHLINLDCIHQMPTPTSPFHYRTRNNPLSDVNYNNFPFVVKGQKIAITQKIVWNQVWFLFYFFFLNELQNVSTFFFSTSADSAQQNIIMNSTTLQQHGLCASCKIWPYDNAASSSLWMWTGPAGNLVTGKFKSDSHCADQQQLDTGMRPLTSKDYFCV